jgi:hypothetical protein
VAISVSDKNWGVMCTDFNQRSVRYAVLASVIGGASNGCSFLRVMQVFSQIKQNPYKKALILWVFDGDLEKLARIQQIEVVLKRNRS